MEIKSETVVNQTIRKDQTNQSTMNSNQPGINFANQTREEVEEKKEEEGEEEEEDEVKERKYLQN